MKIIAIKFKENGKNYYFDTNNLDLNFGDNVIVDTEKGLQFGNVCSEEIVIDNEKKDDYYNKILKVANEKDIEANIRNDIDAMKALEKAKEISLNLKLNMKFIEAKFNFDRTQLIFYFNAENRVDFRELAKQLASIYRTRIELRQIGVRDKAKAISGVGVCGRKLCCSAFLKDLDSVSINMAKNQNIALNPNKINGACGRLLCCLNFEDCLYTQNRKDMPEVGEVIELEGKKGIVSFIDIPNKKYIVNCENGGKIEVCLEEECENCDK